MEQESSSDYFQMEEPDMEKRQKDKKRFQQGVMTVIGGILIQMFNGSFFLWPTLSIYVLSYLYQFNPSIDENAHFRTNLMLVLLNCTGYQIGPYLANIRKWNPKKIVALGSSIAITGIVISSYMTNFWLFVLFYGAFSGIGCGTGYIVPLICCWEYFPNRKGMMTGIIVGSYGIGSLIFTQVATRIVNPHGFVPHRDIGIEDYKLFEAEVANNVPKMLRSLAIIYAIQCIIGVTLISRPIQEQQNNEDSSTDFESQNDINESNQKKYDTKTKQILREYDLVSVFACLQSKRFWEYFSFFVFSDLFCVLFMGQYKSLGLAHGFSDHFLSMAASFSSISQTAGRFFASTLYDWYGVKPVFLTMMIANFLMAILLYDSLNSPQIYFFFIQLNFFLIGGIFSLFPTPIIKGYGPKYGPQVYTLSMLGGVVSSILVTLMMQFLFKPLGLRGLFSVGAASSFVTIIQISRFDERIDIEELDKKGLIVWGKAIKKEEISDSDDNYEMIEVSIVDNEKMNSSQAEIEQQEVESSRTHMSIKKAILQNKNLYSQKSFNMKQFQSIQSIMDAETQSDTTRHTEEKSQEGSREGSAERLIERDTENKKEKKQSTFYLRAQTSPTPCESDWSQSDSDDDSQKQDKNKKIQEFFSLVQK